MEEEVKPQLSDGEPIAVLDTIANADGLLKQVAAANCTAMYVKVVFKGERGVKYKECALHGMMSLTLKIVQSSKNIRLLNIQAEGGLMAVFDTPMKKDVEEMISLAAQVRSANDVVLTKLGMSLDNQEVTVGLDYGPVSSYNGEEGKIEEKFFAGQSMVTAKKLTALKDGWVIISDNIFINLSEDMQKNLFTYHKEEEETKYHYSPLINTRMQKWVDEHQK